MAFNRDWDNAPMIAIKGKQHLVTIAAEEFDHKVLGTSVGFLAMHRTALLSQKSHAGSCAA